MALVLSGPQYTSITSDCVTVVVTDITPNYNAVTAPQGYGSPNEARANLYLKLLVNLRKSTGREVITVPAYNENTAASWSLTTAEDGWYEVYFFACKVWSAVITYALDYIAYDVATDKYYQSIQAGNLNNAVTNATWWKVITDIEDFVKPFSTAVVQSDIYQSTTNHVELCRSRKCEGQMLLKAQCECCDDCGMQEYEKVRMKIEAAGYQEALADYSAAQEIVENLNVVCANLEDCGCS